MLFSTALAGVLDQSPAQTYTSWEPGDELGTWIAAGDLDGDGLGDFSVAAGGNNGKVLRASGRQGAYPDYTFFQRGSGFGYQVEHVGDLDNDGLGELVVAFDDGSGSALYIDYDSAGAVLPVFSTSYCGGDPNGDSVHDLIVGLPQSDGGDGALAIYWGATGGADLQNPTLLPGEPGSGTGVVVACIGYVDGNANSEWATTRVTGEVLVGTGSTVLQVLSDVDPSVLVAPGDLNGDGYDDLVVKDAGNGGLRVHYSDSMALGLAVAHPALTGLYAPAGDVNGDGYDDLLVLDGSTVALHLGSPTGLEDTPDTILTTPVGATAQFGFAALGVGDVDGDGFGDVVVGAPGYASGTGWAGLYLGSASPSVDEDSGLQDEDPKDPGTNSQLPAGCAASPGLGTLALALLGLLGLRRR